MKRLILLSTSLGLLSCGDNNFPKYEALGGLRVLALTSTTPEVLAGSGSVSVVPFVSDVNGAGRALNYDAEACLAPTLDYGGDPTCAGNPTRQVLAQGSSITAGQLTATNGYTGTVDTLTAAAPSAALLSALDSNFQYNGVPLLITFRVYAGGESVNSFRRILVTTNGSKTLNTNPTLNDILASGSPIGGTLPGSAVSLTPSYPSSGAGAPESYTEFNRNGVSVSRSETFSMTWFISAGELSAARTLETAATQFTPPGSLPPLGRVVLVGVLRDGRGGVTVLQKNLQ